MVKNLSPDPRFSEKLSILSFEDTRKVQFESYCRASYYQVVWIKEGSAVFEVDMMVSKASVSVEKVNISSGLPE
ncbi:hypothetical protein FACS1894174_09840 [Bacteroidia bacterium]|nr:hypothetical protein FACS1894174_09840 [Bacteroidia bacterium]